MKKVYQTVVDKTIGNCMQAAVASLFNKELEEVPNFIEYDNWVEIFDNFVKEQGYEFSDILYNSKFSNLLHFKEACFNEMGYVKEGLIHNLNIVDKHGFKYDGVDGFFYAVVCSPKNFEFNDQCYHAVIIDRECNIVHDPNKEYLGIIQYPFSDLVNYSGVVKVYIFNKIK